MTMTVTFSITGATLEECMSKLGTQQAEPPMDTDALLELLRSRMRSQGLDVVIARAENKQAETGNGADTEIEVPAKAKRGRPPLSEKEKEQRAKAKEPEPEPKSEPEPESSEGPTREAVIEALTAYSEANGGMVASRKIMQEVCGATRLADVPTAKYATLIERLAM
jgi:hypothetical protein